MIKRNSRNIGKRVRIVGHKDFDGREGKVVGFRGDYDKNDPWVNVFVYSVGQVLHALLQVVHQGFQQGSREIYQSV